MTRSNTPILTAKQICYAQQNRLLVDNVNLTLKTHSVTAIIGPNGAGKSTLLRLLSGFLAYQHGEIMLCGKPLVSWSAMALAETRAVMTQCSETSLPYTVNEIIMLGRPLNHPENSHVIAEAIRLTECEPLLFCQYRHLSGGEQQRVQLARVFAQLGGSSLHSRLLFLDEPTSALDLHHQQSLLRMLRQQVNSKPLAVCCVLHDLNLAALYADQIILLHHGAILAQGTPSEVLKADILVNGYKAALNVDRHPLTDAPRVFHHFC